MRESEVERMLVDGIRKLGGRAFKWVSPGNDGGRIGSLSFRDSRQCSWN